MSETSARWTGTEKTSDFGPQVRSDFRGETGSEVVEGNRRRPKVGHDKVDSEGASRWRLGTGLPGEMGLPETGGETESGSEIRGEFRVEGEYLGGFWSHHCKRGRRGSRPGGHRWLCGENDINFLVEVDKRVAFVYTKKNLMTGRKPSLRLSRETDVCTFTGKGGT